MDAHLEHLDPIEPKNRWSLTSIGLGITIAALLLVTAAPARSSCYGWREGDRATINLQDRHSGYLRLWSNTKLDGQIVSRLKHGTKFRVIDFIESPTCGGTVYLEAVVNNRRVRGWVNSDVLVGYSK